MFMPTNPPKIPIKSANTTNNGIIKVVARILVITKYLNGLMADTSIASICSVTFMQPNSAPMPDEIFPAQIRAVIIGETSFIRDRATMHGNHASAPNFTIVGLDCKVRTKPIMKPVIPTNGSAL